MIVCLIKNILFVIPSPASWRGGISASTLYLAQKMSHDTSSVFQIFMKPALNSSVSPFIRQSK